MIIYTHVNSPQSKDRLSSAATVKHQKARVFQNGGGSKLSIKWAREGGAFNKKADVNQKRFIVSPIQIKT